MNTTTQTKRRPFGVEIIQTALAYLDVPYDLTVSGWAEFTAEEARLSAEEAVARRTASTGRPHRAVLWVICPCCSFAAGTYKCKTLEPGYKRKPCSFCDGTGRVS